MKRTFLRWALLVWTLFAVTSAAMFAFTGVPIWAPLPVLSGEGFLRFVLLVGFHMAGPIWFICL